MKIKLITKKSTNLDGVVFRIKAEIEKDQDISKIEIFFKSTEADGQWPSFFPKLMYKEKIKPKWTNNNLPNKKKVRITPVVSENNIKAILRVHGKVKHFGLHILDYKIIFNIKDTSIAPPNNNKKTLILLHGFRGDPDQMKLIMKDSNIQHLYGNIINVDLYNFSGNTPNRSIGIEDFSAYLRDYLFSKYKLINEYVDFIAHSMGGLIIRYMIKQWYYEIKGFFDIKRSYNFQIHHVCMIATPNHGVPLARLAFWDKQACDIDFISKFIKNLNKKDETPYGLGDPNGFIQWYTYRGSVLFNWDYVVPTKSVPLKGASANRGEYPLSHDKLLSNKRVIEQIYLDLLSY